jgi:hypothetical protein
MPSQKAHLGQFLRIEAVAAAIAPLFKLAINSESIFE